MQFEPGFRLSLLDTLVLLAASGLIGLVFLVDRTLSAAIAVVVLHFFLFCNVFRMSRSLELIWAAAFVLLAIMSLKFNFLAVGNAGVICLSLSCFLVVLQMRKPSYHGIFWQKINPNLNVWFGHTTSGQ